jgi:anti-sigma B factor antagonist
MDAPFTIQSSGNYTVVEFLTSSLMDPVQLESIGARLYRLVDEEDKRGIILDFAQVEFISSQFIGILLTLHKKLGEVKGGKLVLCGVGPRLSELIKITRLDRLLTIKPSRGEAMQH